VKIWFQNVPFNFNLRHYNVECKLRHHYDITNAEGKVTATAVIGEVVMFHIHEEVVGLVQVESKLTHSLKGAWFQPLTL
jgi:flavin reductase (DIM6/NTAB) family NADH-FMN oxidoreductase RutF